MKRVKVPALGHTIEPTAAEPLGPFFAMRSISRTTTFHVEHALHQTLVNRGDDPADDEHMTFQPRRVDVTEFDNGDRCVALTGPRTDHVAAWDVELTSEHWIEAGEHPDTVMLPSLVLAALRATQ